MRILVVDDDVPAATSLIRALAQKHIEAHHAEDIAEGLIAARKGGFDVLVIDRMLPQGDGVDMVTQLRAEHIMTPVLFLSALDAIDERVKGLEAGGDDYLTKPFALAELIARVQVLARRKTEDMASDTILRFADLSLDMLARKAMRGDVVLPLQPREFDLLSYFMRNQGQLITRAMLLKHIWNYDFDPQTNVVDVHISRLRGKMDKGQAPALLHTIRGEGYILRL